MPKAQCPKCKTPLDAAKSTRQVRKKPEEGDYTICIECHAILAFGPGMCLVIANEAEMPQEIRDHIIDVRIHLRDIKRKR